MTLHLGSAGRHLFASMGIKFCADGQPIGQLIGMLGTPDPFYQVKIIRTGLAIISPRCAPSSWTVVR